MFKELFESKIFYIISFKSKLTKPEIDDLKTVANFKIVDNEIETTDKKVYNKLLDKLDEIGLEYDNFVEMMK